MDASIQKSIKMYLDTFKEIKKIANVNATEYKDIEKTKDKLTQVKQKYQNYTKNIQTLDVNNPIEKLLHDYKERNENFINNNYENEQEFKTAYKINHDLNNLLIKDLLHFTNLSYNKETTKKDILLYINSKMLKKIDVMGNGYNLESVKGAFADTIMSEIVQYTSQEKEKFEAYVNEIISKEIKVVEKDKQKFNNLIEKYIISNTLTDEFIQKLKHTPCSTLKNPSLKDKLTTEFFREKLKNVEKKLQTIYSTLFLSYVKNLHSYIDAEDNDLNLFFQSKIKQQKHKFDFFMNYYDASVHKFMLSLNLNSQEKYNNIYSLINDSIAKSIENYIKINTPIESRTFVIMEFHKLAYNQAYLKVKQYLEDTLINKSVINKNFIDFCLMSIICPNNISLLEKDTITKEFMKSLTAVKTKNITEKIARTNLDDHIIAPLEKEMAKLKIADNMILKDQFKEKLNSTFEKNGFAPLKETNALENFVLLALSYNYPLIFYCNVLDNN